MLYLFMDILILKWFKKLNKNLNVMSLFLFGGIYFY